MNSKQLNVKTTKHDTTMLPLMSKVAASLLLSASTFINPTTPKVLSFDASAFVTVSNKIRIAVQKSTEAPVTIVLRNAENQVLFQQDLGKKESKFAVKLNVDDLADGQYELEIKSNKGSINKYLNLSTAPIQMQSRIVAVQ
ncbi:hypothetical protein SAMN05216167_1245 [Spirosoma endophyticum]|uniref:Por secretion system C-terminal sorting domain-containing protein n=2 Tax=Spirosoma endophyticum TaxID=662367 RepID=A0A1I2F295_9BACT|nr:hypothetical protein SAMN05216167_1245 [Spirosoma endophyticum]